MRAGTEKGPAGPVVDGPRVRLRPPVAADGPGFTAAVRRSAELHRGWATPPTDAAAFDAYLARVALPTVVGFLVVRHDDGALVGRVTLSQIVHGDFQNAYVGYEALAGQERRGLMTEAVGLALDHAFGPLRLHRVEANVQPDNVPSLALVRRLGFRREGRSREYLRVADVWRDHERWAILAREHRGGTPVPVSGSRQA